MKSKKKVVYIVLAVLVVAAVIGVALNFMKKKPIDLVTPTGVTIENFTDSTITLEAGKKMYLENHVLDTNGNIYRLNSTVTTKSGDEVKVRQNEFTVNSFEGYNIKYTVNVEGNEYAKNVILNTTGISCDNTAEQVSVGTTVKFDEAVFMVDSKVSDVPVKTEIEYITDTKMHGYEISQKGNSFKADICGEFHVKYSANYNDKEYSAVKKYSVVKKYPENMIADYHSPAVVGTSELCNIEYYASYKGEVGAAKLIKENSSFPQLHIKTIYPVDSYRNKGYKYVVFRMYFPEDELTWSNMQYGIPVEGKCMGVGSITKGEWKDYYISADVFFQYANDIGGDASIKLFSGQVKDKNGNPANGAVAYISEIRMEKEYNYRLCEELVNGAYTLEGIKILKKADDAQIQDAAIREEIAKKGSVLEYTKGSTATVTQSQLVLQLIENASYWDSYVKKFKETGQERFLKVRMYMPDGMEWKGRVTFAWGNRVYSNTSIKTNQWVDYIFDLKSVVESGKKPWAVFYGENGATVKDGKSIIYVSDIEWLDATVDAFPDSNQHMSKGSTMNMSIGAAKGWKVSYSSSNPAVATVDSDGKVTARDYGKTVITMKLTANGKTETRECTVYVQTIPMIGSNETITSGDYTGKGVKILTKKNISEAAISDSAIRDELENVDSITEYMVTAPQNPSKPMFVVQKIENANFWADYLKIYEQGMGRFMKIRIYMPEGMAWKDKLTFAWGNKIASNTEIRAGEWVDYIFDMKPVVESGKKPWAVFYSELGAEILNGKNVVYVSSIEFLDASMNAFSETDKSISKGTVIHMGVGNIKGCQISYSSSNDAVATVDADGKVTAVGLGKTVITMTVRNGSSTQTKSCNVYVQNIATLGFNESIVNSNYTTEGVKILTKDNISEAVISDEAIKKELENTKSITEFISGSDPRLVIQAIEDTNFWNSLLQKHKSGSCGFLKIRMYMPDGMAWVGPVTYGWTNHVDSYTEIQTGKWVDYIFDLREILDAGKCPWAVIHGKAGAGLKDGKNIVYVSAVEYLDTNYAAFADTEKTLAKGDVVPMGIGTVNGCTVSYATSNKAVATVDANGKVTAVGYGKAVITLTIAGNGTTETKTCTIYVKKNSTGSLHESIGVVEDPNKKGVYTVDVKSTGSNRLVLCNKKPATGKITLTYTVESTNLDSKVGLNGFVGTSESKLNDTGVGYSDTTRLARDDNRVLRKGMKHTFTLWLNENGQIDFTGGAYRENGSLEDYASNVAGYFNAGPSNKGTQVTQYLGIYMYADTTVKLKDVTCVDEKGNDLGVRINAGANGTAGTTEQKKTTYTVDIKSTGSNRFALCNKKPATGKVTLTYTVESTNLDSKVGLNGFVGTSDSKLNEAGVGYSDTTRLARNDNRVLRKGMKHTFTLWLNENGQIDFTGGAYRENGTLEDYASNVAGYFNAGPSNKGTQATQYLGIYMYADTTVKLKDVTCVDENGNDLGVRINAGANGVVRASGSEGVQILTAENISDITDEKVKSELQKITSITKFSLATTDVKFQIKAIDDNDMWDALREGYVNSEMGRYLKVRMYMPDGMEWKGKLCFGKKDDGEGHYVYSETAVQGGEWVDYYFDLKAIFEANMKPEFIIYATDGANLTDGFNTVYLSDIAFCDTAVTGNSVQKLATNVMGKCLSVAKNWLQAIGLNI